MQKTDLVEWRQVDSFIGSHTSPVLTATRQCPVCGGFHSRKIFSLEDFQMFSDSASVPKRVDVHQAQCSSCAAIFMNPCFTPTGFSCLFSEAGQSYGSASERPVEQVNWLESRGLLKSGSVFLDVGCYEGGFLNTLPSSITRIGVDIDAPAVGRGNLKYASSGINLYSGPLESFSVPDRVDVISMFHVLEHVADPLAVLKNLRKLAHAETKLVVEVPILEFGDTNDINGFMSVQHMTHFSYLSLTNLVARSGWAILERTQVDGYNGHRLLLTVGEDVAVDHGEKRDFVKVRAHLAHWNKSIATIGAKLGQLTGGKVVVWGAGFHTELLYQLTSLFLGNEDRQFLLIDSERSKHGKTWRGIPICAPDVLRDIDWRDCDLIVSSYGAQEAIKINAIDLGVPEEKIHTLYEYGEIY